MTLKLKTEKDEAFTEMLSSLKEAVKHCKTYDGVAGFSFIILLPDGQVLYKSKIITSSSKCMEMLGAMEVAKVDFMEKNVDKRDDSSHGEDD